MDQQNKRHISIGIGVLLAILFTFFLFFIAKLPWDRAILGSIPATIYVHTLGWFWWHTIKYLIFWFRAQKTVGIVEHTSQHQLFRSRKIRYSASVAFTDTQGKKHIHYTGAIYKKPLKIGQSITIYYQEKDPSEAKTSKKVWREEIWNYGKYAIASSVFGFFLLLAFILKFLLK